MSSSSASSTPPPAGRGKWWSGALLTALLVTLLVALIGGLGWRFLRPDSELDTADNPARPVAVAPASTNSSATTAPQSSSDSADTSSEIASLPNTKKSAQRQTLLQQGVRATADWPTEVFSERATTQLKQLAKLAPHIADSSDALRAFVSPKFECNALRPTPLETAYQSASVQVRRRPSQPSNKPSNKSNSNDALEFQGVDGLAAAIEQLFTDVNQDERVALKIVRVQAVETGFVTAVHAEGGGHSEQGRRQWTAWWRCIWSGDAKLLAIFLDDYEEVLSTAGSQAWLVDDTDRVLGKAAGYRDQLLYGMDYWVNKLEHRFYVNRLGHHGLAIGDINGDGLEDIYVCQPGGLPNRLYVHQPDGSATDQSTIAGVDFLDDTTAALFVDLDNDGDQDLALLTVSGGFVFDNDQGHFRLQATMPDCRNAFSITATDYDQDGKLDLYVGRYWPDESVRGSIPLPVPYYDALNGGSNVLLQNQGDWKFVDVTEAVGFQIDNTRYTMAATWEDYDNDGDQDLYVANDFGRNCLYQNNQGRFTNVAATAGVEDTAAGMSVSWADYNHDGHMDAYVGNMFSSAGNRIAYQRQYAQQFEKGAQAKLQRLARGNSLFQNKGDGQFSDQSLRSHTYMGRWAWGSVFTDLNNDSWDDLVVANGHVTTADTGDL